MEIVGPVIGIGAIISFITGGIVMVRLLTSKITRHELKSRGVGPTERDHILENVQVRFGDLDQLKQRMSELEERVDFTERLLATQREGLRLGPSQDQSAMLSTASQLAA
jgi:predicted nuclease with TOPRIM domain